MLPAGVPEKDPLSGRLGHLDPGQQHVLNKFKKELESDGLYKPGDGPQRDDVLGGGNQGASHDDATLLRFLRARKFDLAKSKHMFSESEKWRREFNVDELYKTFEYPEKAEVDAIYPQFYHKTDIEGRPVYIERLGNLDLQKLYKVTTPERGIQRLVVEYEKFLRDRLPVCSVEKGELVDTSCTIMDLSNVGIGQFWQVKNYVQQASHLSQNYYPETMGKFYIVNAPYLFSTVWSWVKPWLDEVTVKKIAILGYNPEKTLLEQISAESLPKSLGGACSCEEGCSMSDAGPWMDEGLVKRTQKRQAGQSEEEKAEPQEAKKEAPKEAGAPAAAPTEGKTEGAGSTSEVENGMAKLDVGGKAEPKKNVEAAPAAPAQHQANGVPAGAA